jgi:hypothetical protein
VRRKSREGKGERQLLCLMQVSLKPDVLAGVRRIWDVVLEALSNEGWGFVCRGRFK